MDMSSDEEDTSSSKNQLSACTPIVDFEGCLQTTLESSSSFELIEVQDDDNGTVPLDSSRITLKHRRDYGRYQLLISIRLKSESATFRLRVRMKNPPVTTWTCVFTHQVKNKSCSVEREHSVKETPVTSLPTTTPYGSDSSIINILLVGRSQVGKSTLIESLNDLTYSSTRTGISQTRDPLYRQLTITSNEGDRQYTLNIIDTPGLREIRHDPNETRTDEQLLALMRGLFDDGRIRSLNIIAFVSKMGKTYQDDIDTFKSLINFFGPQFSSISALILTHCDKISTERANELTEELKRHPKCAEVVNYCKLGVYHHGTLDMDDLETYDSVLRERVRELTLLRLGPMRMNLLEFILSTARTGVKLSESSFRHLSRQVNDNPRAQACTIM